MDFAKQLRARVRSGEITRSVRIWMRPNVKPGNRYRMGDGTEIEVDAIEQIELADITVALARASGFTSVSELLKTAKHGRGMNVYVVRFHCTTPEATVVKPRQKPSVAKAKQQLARVLKELPEAVAVPSGTHLRLEVRKKNFAYLLDDHHGDGRIALHCKASADVRDALQQTAPEQLHVPKYPGHKGWIGLWLDRPGTDWSAFELALREAYLLVAPKRRAAKS